jgi:transposase-like protein
VKYSKELSERICELFASGETTVADVCKAVGISQAVYFKWKAEKVEFLEALKKAEKLRLDAFRNMARSGLAALLVVQELEETTTEYVDKEGKPTVKSRKVTKRKVMPSATAVIFALKNLDSENFKDKQVVQHEGEMGFVWQETKTFEGGEAGAK